MYKQKLRSVQAAKQRISNITCSVAGLHQTTLCVLALLVIPLLCYFASLLLLLNGIVVLAVQTWDEPARDKNKKKRGKKWKFSFCARITSLRPWFLRKHIFDLHVFALVLWDHGGLCSDAAWWAYNSDWYTFDEVNFVAIFQSDGMIQVIMCVMQVTTLWFLACLRRTIPRWKGRSPFYAVIKSNSAHHQAVVPIASVVMVIFRIWRF